MEIELVEKFIGAHKNEFNIQSKSEIQKIETITGSGGLSGDQVYKVTIHNNDFIIKKLGKEETLERYIYDQNMAAQANLAPKIFAWDQEFVSMPFITTDAFPYQDSKKICQLWVNFLHKFHSLPKDKSFESRISTKKIYDVIYQEAQNMNGKLERKILDKIEAVLRNVQDIQLKPYVFSHNDLNPGNIRIQNSQLIAIDFETSGLNDPLMDVAHIANWFFFDPNEQLIFLEAYLKRLPIHQELEHFKKLQIIRKLFTVISLLKSSLRMGLKMEMVQEHQVLPLLVFLQKMKIGEIKLNSSINLYQFAHVIIHSMPTC